MLVLVAMIRVENIVYLKDSLKNFLTGSLACVHCRTGVSMNYVNNKMISLQMCLI